MMEYLPEHTLNWCNDALLSADIDPKLVNAGAMHTNQVKLHQHAYQTLRTLIRQHHQSQPEMPPLEHSSKPTGGYEHVEATSYVMRAIIQENAESSAAPRSSGEEGQAAYALPEELVDHGDNIFYEIEDDAMLMPVDD